MTPTELAQRIDASVTGSRHACRGRSEGSVAGSIARRRRGKGKDWKFNEERSRTIEEHHAAAESRAPRTSRIAGVRGAGGQHLLSRPNHAVLRKRSFRRQS
jgi:hypothetical protein